MMTGKDEVELKPVLLNGTYAIMKSYIKPYASCRYTHPSVEAAIRMRSQVNPEDVECIDIKTYALAVFGHDHKEITGSYSAKMSIPYATAVGLIYGRAGLQEFSREVVNSEKVRSLTKKIDVKIDEELSLMFPQKQSAIVTIKTKNGFFSERVDYPKGEPENPLTDEEFKMRYDGLMGYGGVKKSTSDIVFIAVNREETLVRELVEKIG